MHKSINNSVVAESIASAGTRQVIRNVAHTFHTPCNDDIAISCLDTESSLHDGFHARSTHLVDGGTGHVQMQARVDHSLAGGSLRVGWGTCTYRQ